MVAALGDVALGAFWRVIASGAIAARVTAVACLRSTAIAGAGVAAIAGVAPIAGLASATIAGSGIASIAGVTGCAAIAARAGVAAVASLRPAAARIATRSAVAGCTLTAATGIAAGSTVLALRTTRPAILGACAPWMTATAAARMGCGRMRRTATAAMRCRRGWLAASHSDCAEDEYCECDRPNREKKSFCPT